MRDTDRGLWQEWGTAAFAAAQSSGRPVLLFLHTRWSTASGEMAETIFRDVAIASRIRDLVVPVAVDADRRPDIADRYTLGGWPTIAFLTPHGDLLGGGTWLDRIRLLDALERLDRAWQAGRDTLSRNARAARARRRAEAECQHAVLAVPGVPGGLELRLDADADLRVAALLDGLFDEAHGGFGEAPRLAQAAPVAFSLHHGLRTGEAVWVDRAAITLDRLGWGPMSDHASGAFHRAALAADWTRVDPAVLLDVQADLIGLFLAAGVALDEGGYIERARAALETVHDRFEDAARGGYRSHAGDAALFTDANARMIRAGLQASGVLGVARWGEAAFRALERVVPAVYARGAGVAHVLETVPRIRGLLTDQVRTAGALLDAADASGSAVYRELAEELMRSALRRYADPLSGGLLDRIRTSAGAGDIGLLGEPLVPYSANCEAARVLARLARDTGHADLHVAARRVLASQTSVYLDQGPLAAEYALALADLSPEP